MDAPQLAVAPRFIHTMSRFCTMQSSQWTFQNGLAHPTSGAWPTANKAIYLPINLPFRFHLRRFFIANGSAVSGNFDIGLYTIDGVKVATVGSTAQSGTSTVQYAGSLDIVLPPGGYYLAVAMDNTTGTLMRYSPTANITGRLTGMLEQASAFALPATMTPATVTESYQPLCGFTSTASGY